MKGQPFYRRLGFALSGWKEGYWGESSLRTQVAAAVAAIVATAWVGPSLVWWALIVISISLVLAAELFNTALERMIDGLHPGQAEFVRQAKDCAAGAVLVFSFSSVVIFGLMLASAWG